MKLNGLDIEITRGETASITYDLKDSSGKPFVFLNSDMFDKLEIAFKVKPNSQTITSAYLINKSFNINHIIRFDSEEIINIKEFMVGQGTYDKFTWSGCLFSDPLAVWPNQLYYHPDLNEYRYFFEEDIFTLYDVTLTVSFDPSDTKDIPYATYYYDLVLEASNGDIIEYENILVNQHRFSVAYRV